MKLAFATLGCPGWTIDEVALRAREMGYDGVELRGVAGEHIGPDEPAAERRRIRELFAANGVEIASIMGYATFAHDDAEKRAGNVEHARKMIGLAKDVGCPIVRVFGGQWNGLTRDRAIGLVGDCLAELGPVAEAAGVTLALETHDDWCKGDNVRAVLAKASSPAIKVCWDVANGFFDDPLAVTWEAIGADVVHVHFKDVKLVDGKHQSVLTGEGDVDLAGAVRLLHEGGYDAYLSFEWEKKWQPEIPEPEVALPHFVAAVRGMLAAAGA